MAECYLSWRWMQESVKLWVMTTSFIYVNLGMLNTKQWWVMLTMAGLKVSVRNCGIQQDCSLVGLKTGVRFGHHLWEPDVSAYWRVSCCKQGNSNSPLSGVHTPVWPPAGEGQSQLKLSPSRGGQTGIPPLKISPPVLAQLACPRQLLQPVWPLTLQSGHTNSQKKQLRFIRFLASWMRKLIPLSHWHSRHVAGRSSWLANPKDWKWGKLLAAFNSVQLNK